MKKKMLPHFQMAKLLGFQNEKKIINCNNNLTTPIQTTPVTY